MTTVQRPVLAILVGGGTAAVLDIVYAFIRNGIGGRDPLWVLQFVASGIMGKDAFNNGVTAGAVGLLVHTLILLVAATIYYFASQKWVVLKTQSLLLGALFGIGVYLFMNFVAVPISAVPFRMTYDVPKLLEGFVSHAALVGLPIALAVKRWT
jgi:hypothetical protein